MLHFPARQACLATGLVFALSVSGQAQPAQPALTPCMLLNSIDAPEQMVVCQVPSGPYRGWRFVAAKHGTRVQFLSGADTAQDPQVIIRLPDRPMEFNAYVLAVSSSQPLPAGDTITVPDLPPTPEALVQAVQEQP